MFLVFSYSVKYFPWEDRQSLICNSLTRLLRLLYGKSNIHPLETALQILHLDLSWTSKMWFNPSWWCWAAAMSPGFRSPLWSWGKQPTPCRVLSGLSGEHYRLRVSCVLLRPIVFKLMVDSSRLIIVKFDVQTLWIYIKLTFPPQWQKVEHGICFAKLITKRVLTLESWNTSFYKGGTFIHSHGFKHACLSPRSASGFKSRQETNNNCLRCDWALKSCALMPESAAMFHSTPEEQFPDVYLI